MIQQLQSQQQYFLQQFQLFSIFFDDDNDFIQYPSSWHVAALCTNQGMGQGRVFRNKRRTYEHIDLYSFWSKYHQDKFSKLLHTTLDEFNIILKELLLVHDTHSRLHSRLKYIIDGTLHKTQKQHVDYNGHYRMHGKLTQILLD